LPQALSIGVDYRLFWTLTPKKLIPFVKAKEEEMKVKSMVMNNEAWLIGLYVQSAIASVFSKSYKYPKQPTGSDDRKGQTKEAEFKSQFEVFAKEFNKSLKNKK
jgi:hypothetical protein